MKECYIVCTVSPMGVITVISDDVYQTKYLAELAAKELSKNSIKLVIPVTSIIFPEP